MQGFLKATQLAKRFSRGEYAAVRDVSLSVNKGEIFTLLGPSGCGKTTTLRLIAGFEAPDAGRIYLDEKDITALPPEQRDIGIVFQDYALFPHLNLQDNIIFALWKNPRKERKKNSMGFLEMVGLQDYSRHMPHELSGGQQQRAALARALAAGPRILLLDEPFSNLDTSLRQSVRSEIRALLHARGTTCVLVTHDQEEALSFSDRMALMNEGRIEQTGTPEDIYSAPSTRFAAQFLGRTNLIEGKAHGALAETALGTIPLQTEARGDVLLSLRPEHIAMRPANSDGHGNGVLLRREFKGHDMTHWVQIGDTQIQVDTDFTCTLRAGATVNISIRQAAVVLKGSQHQKAQGVPPKPNK
jgi:iron(III) transport system ATP-binding protein